MKQFLLLISKFTFVPVPKKFSAPYKDLAVAMRFLPVLGLFCGAIMFFSAKLLVFVPAPVAALLLVGINILFGGFYLLKELMTVADGISGQPIFPAHLATVGVEAKKKPVDDKGSVRKNRLHAGKAGLVWGMIWLIVLYAIYLTFFWQNLFPNIVFLLAPIISYWFMSWTIYGFYAKAPAWLHNNFSKRDFIIASMLTLLFIVPFSQINFIIALVVAFFGVYIFASFRQRSVGGLADSCYGAAAAWGQILFYLAWLTFAQIF
jgi:cobalamin synthase